MRFGRKILSNVYLKIEDSDDIPMTMTFLRLKQLLLPDYVFKIPNKDRATFLEVKVYIEQQEQTEISSMEVANNIFCYLGKIPIPLLELRIVQKKKKLNF